MTIDLIYKNRNMTILVNGEERKITSIDPCPDNCDYITSEMINISHHRIFIPDDKVRIKGGRIMFDEEGKSMSMIDWARKEIEIAKKREREASGNEDGWDYGCACYDSALKAYESLCEDGHSGMSIGFTKQILNRLIDGKVLTPIEDTPDMWNVVSWSECVYQCKRMSSLFKKIDRDGNIVFTDNDYAVYVDMKSNTMWHSKRVSDYVYSKYPITMPYMPNDRPYKVYCEDFMYKKPKAVGEYDHFAMIYMIKPNGEREEVNKYFMEQDNKTIEIDKKLYEKHKEETFG